MKKLTKDLGSYNLHMIKTDKFKTTKVRVIFQDNIKKEDITIRNMLIDMLTLTTKEFNTKQKLAIESGELYAAAVHGNNIRIGNHLNTNLNLDILDEKYTEEGMLEKSIEFLSKIIFKPNVTNNKFDSNSFEIVKKDTELTIKSIKEETKKYSIIRLLEEMNSNLPTSYRGFGYIEDLDKINEEVLYEYYQKMLKTNLVDIYIIGNIDFSETEQIFRKYFHFETFKKAKEPVVIKQTESKGSVKVSKEQDDLNQTKLAMGLKLINLTEEETNYALTLYNILLGGGTDSKLFQQVREKNSLAYTVHSFTNKNDNLLIITAGISKSNYEKCQKIIKEQLKLMEKGDFSDKDIDNAKQLYMTAMDELEESPSQLVEAHYMIDLLKLDDIETRKTKMQKVNKEQIISVAKKVKLDTIFLLEGMNEHEEN